MQSKSSKTIRIKVVSKVREETYEKNWTLLTSKEAVNAVLKQGRKEQVERTFWSREKGKIGNIL